MAVYDRWHTRNPRPGKDGQPARPCREHKLFPSAEHGQGDRWQVRWRDDNGEQKKLNRPKKGGKRNDTDPDIYADALDAKITAELNAGIYIDPANGKILLEDFVKQWRSNLTGDPNTLWGLDKRLAHIIDIDPRPLKRKARRPKGGPSVIGKKPMATLAKRPSLTQKWIKTLEDKGLSPSYIKRIFDTLSSIFIAAIDDGIVDRNPTKAKSLRLPKPEEKKIVPWTLSQVKAGAEALGDDAAIVYLGVGAGLRQGEIFGLAADDIDFDERVIHIRRQVRLVTRELVFSLPKGDKERDVPMSDSLAHRLHAHLRERDPVEVTLPWKRPEGKPHTAGLLFTRTNGQPHHSGVFNYTWQTVRRKAGVPETPENGMHILRHTAASAWLASGVDIRTVAEYLGHSDPGFTLRTYMHLMPNAADRARAAMDAFFNPRKTEN